VRKISDPDFVYTPWSPQRRAHASAAAKARVAARTVDEKLAQLAAMIETRLVRLGRAETRVKQIRHEIAVLRLRMRRLGK
jgi:hypothetical protein